MNKKYFFSWCVVLLGVVIITPLAAHAASTALTSIIPGASSGSVCLCPGSAPDWGCVLQTLQNIMNDVVGFAAIIISLFIAQAGFTYMTSSGNPEKRQLANKRILNAVLGLVIALSAWLLVDSIMKVLYNPNAPLNGSTFGPWNSILVSNGADYCIKQQKAPGVIAALTQSGTPSQLAGGGTVPPGTAPAAGAIPAAICTASAAYKGTSTASGPGGGSVACAWAVNNVLTNAGISPIGGNAVSGMESALQGGRGTAITQSAAVCGDIVIEADDGHVGICQNSGCTQVLSNSSSHATFTWISDPTFAPSYSDGIGRFYRVTN